MCQAHPEPLTSPNAFTVLGSLGGRCSSDSHLPDEETEAQLNRGEVISPRQSTVNW